MAAHASPEAASAVLQDLRKLLPGLEVLYKDIHAHPELSMHETRTAGIAAERLKKAGYEVTAGVGRTGVGLLRNGEGPTVMLRADMGALPIAEDTGLPYASRVTAMDADVLFPSVVATPLHGELFEEERRDRPSLDGPGTRSMGRPLASASDRSLRTRSEAAA